MNDVDLLQMDVCCPHAPPYSIFSVHHGMGVLEKKDSLGFHTPIP